MFKLFQVAQLGENDSCETDPLTSKLGIAATPSPQIGRHIARKTVRFAASGSSECRAVTASKFEKLRGSAHFIHMLRSSFQS